MKQIILGTDWWTDCDDAVAVRLLTRFARAGRIRLLGVGINACMEYSVASLHAFLTADGMTGVPIGLDRDALDYGGTPRYQKPFAERMQSACTNDDAEDAVRLYRRLLAEADGAVEIVEIGFLQVLVGVLQSPPDDISDKCGLDLVREKVAKVWVMAGKWDGDGEKEHNFCLNPYTRRAGADFCALCPVPATFLGWEIGYGVITGRQLDANDPLRALMYDHGSRDGRHSWDPMLTLLALIGDEAEAGYGTVRGWASVDAETGANYFRVDPEGRHCYVTKRESNRYYEEAIDLLL